MARRAFSGGDVLEAKLKEMAERVSRKASLNVGFLEGATYPDGTPVAQIAAINEFGATGAGRGNSVTIPARPAFRTMIAKKACPWRPAQVERL
jgi:hypothetical protein